MPHSEASGLLARTVRHIQQLPYRHRVFCSHASASQLFAGKHETPSGHDATRADLDVSTSQPAKPTSLDALFKMQSRRRVFGSPMLPLEAVAVHRPVQDRIEQALAASKLTMRDVRLSSKLADSFLATESAIEKRFPKRGAPVVRAPPTYGSAGAISYAVMRSPGTLATNVYVMSETRRCLPDFAPRSMLDFGSGIGVSVMAAARVFNEDPFDAVAGYLEQLNRISKESDGEALKIQSQKDERGRSFLAQAVLVDHSTAMRSLSAEILPADECVGKNIRLSQAASLKDVPFGQGDDMVCASYSLSEIVRDAMANPNKDGSTEFGESVSREDRVKIAESRLKRTLKTLWSRVAPGGILIIVEDGTAAGFETVLFARETILGLTLRPEAHHKTTAADLRKASDIEEANIVDSTLRTDGKGQFTARVIAPCLHSKQCPLAGSVTRHRVCRFQQRFNRPPFLRNARRLPTGYEDEYFSYLVVRKVPVSEAQEAQTDSTSHKPWGRLVRAPLTKGKHMVLDACTSDGDLERRVVSKKNALPGHYSRARKAKWGDIWPIAPRSNPQTVNF